MKKIGDWILQLFCRQEYYSDIRGDLEELYSRRIASSSKIKASFKYFIAVVILLRPSLLKPSKFMSFMNISMINQYIKISSRNFLKHKFNSAINVFGLSIGIAAAILLYGYVRFEQSYDKGYDKAESIYRVTNHSKFGDRIRNGITGSGMLAPTLETEISEIKLAGRVYYFRQPVIQNGENKFRQSRVYYADINLTQILEYEYLQGDAKTALLAPNSIVLSKTTAAKIFEDEENVVGHNLVVNQVPMQVTGVIEDVPLNSNFVPNMLVSMSTMTDISWDRQGTITYVLLEDKVSPNWIDEKMVEMVDRLKLGSPEEDFSVWFDLYPIADIHLSPDQNQEGRGSLSMVYALSLIAVFIILIASINYMNLATARSSQRAKEIGVRKVIGAVRRQISFQFLMESTLVSLISVAIGSFLAFMFQEAFVQMTGVASTIDFLNLDIFLKLAALAVVIGLIAGIYPAIILSSFRPVLVLKGIHAYKGGTGLRRVLVAFQFMISIVLIISTFVIYNQIDFLLNKDLGFNEEAVFVVRLREADPSGILKQEYLQHPNIKSVTATNSMPATGDSGATFTIRNESGEVSKDNVSMATIDNDYLDLMEIELIKGKIFADDNGTNANSIIVNEALVSKYGWKEPLGQYISASMEDDGSPMEKFVIAGIVKDFNMLSLYNTVQPFAFFKKPQFDWGGQYLYIKLGEGDLVKTVTFIQEKFESFDEKSLFSGRFLDVHLESIYKQEQKTAKLFFVFAALTITIACLGLFGLAAYTLERRIKEISIRKVLGATLNDIIKLVSIEFLIIILVSSVVASPLAYFFMEKWLSNFSYHVDVSLLTILMGAFVALLIAMFTISFQALKTAKSNPAITLKCE